jgi:hypothetical protein
MEKVQPVISDALEHFNKFSREEKFAGALGLATLVILTSYLTKSSKKVRTPLRMVKAG